MLQQTKPEGQNPANIPITLGEKKRAISRVLKAIGPTPEFLGPIFLKWLGKAILDHPESKPTVKEIAMGCFGITEKKEAQKKIRNARQAADRWLDDFYDKPPNQFCIRIGLSNPPKVGRRPSYYALEYRRPAQESTAVQARIVSRDPVVNIWQMLIYSEPVHQISLIYDTFDGPAIQGEHNANQSSGSGEVAAACLLGQYLAHLFPPRPVAPKRWRDMPPSMLRLMNQCIIVLGAAVNNKHYEHLRKRDEWRDQQQFHFIAPNTDIGETHSRICRGKIDSHVRDKAGFRYNDPPGADYALISFFRDKANKGVLVGLQGLTTVSTWAAADFMCNQDKLEALFRKLFKNPAKGTHANLAQPWPSFEAVIRVSTCQDGTPGPVELKTVLPYTDSLSLEAIHGFTRGLKPRQTTKSPQKTRLES